jgi:hypothetical protein
MDALIRVSLDLTEKAENKYKLVYEVSNLAKKLVEEQISKKQHEEFGYDVEPSFNSSIKKEKPVQHAIMVKASEFDDSGLVG